MRALLTTMFTTEQLITLRGLVKDDMCAKKNHIASGVERGAQELYPGAGKTGFEWATSIIPGLRKQEALFALLNGEVYRREGAAPGSAKEQVAEAGRNF